MKKYLKKFICITIILLVCVFIGGNICGRSWVVDFMVSKWAWRGPYHHAAIVSTPKKTVSVGEEIYSLINSHLYRHNNGQLEHIELNYDFLGNMKANDIAGDHENLYLASHKNIFSLKNDGLKLIHADFEIYSLAIDGEKIYYVTYTERKEDKYTYALCSYDLSAKMVERLYEFLNNEHIYDVRSQIFTIGNRLLFMDERMNLFWVDSLNQQNRISTNFTKFADNKSFMVAKTSFVMEEDIARLEIVTRGVRLVYMNKVYEYPLQANNLRLYPIVKVIDNKVYFAVNDWSQKKDCERNDCICGYNSSMLLTFNLGNKQFALQKQLEAQEVFVDFSKDKCIYYSRGIVYRNESKLKEGIEIKPCAQYKIVGAVSPIPAYELKLAYHSGRLHYLLSDNRAYLKAEYA